MAITEDDLRRAETWPDPVFAGECERGCGERAAFVFIADEPFWCACLCEKCAHSPGYMCLVDEVYRVTKEPFG